MLSKCGPFSNAIEFTESKLGSPVTMYGEIESSTGAIVHVTFSGKDAQVYTGPDEIAHEITAGNIRELLVGYCLHYPSAKIVSITIHAESADKAVYETVPCTPINPELISTVARKLLKELYVV